MHSAWDMTQGEVIEPDVNKPLIYQRVGNIHNIGFELRDNHIGICFDCKGNTVQL